MKKTKIFGILLLVVMIIFSITNVANATNTEISVSSDAEEGIVETGDEVTIKIHSTQKTEGGNFILDWNRSFLKYKSSSAMAKNLEEGRFEFVDTEGVNDFEIKFEVIATEGKDTVKVTPVQVTLGTDDNYEVITNSNTVELKVKEKVIEPENTVEPENVVEPENSTRPENVVEAENKVKPENKVEAPKKHLQTGYNAGALIVIVAVIAIIARIIIKKNK